MHHSPHQKSECSILFSHNKYENNHEHPLKNYRLPVSHNAKTGKHLNISAYNNTHINIVKNGESIYTTDKLNQELLPNTRVRTFIEMGTITNECNA